LEKQGIKRRRPLAQRPKKKIDEEISNLKLIHQQVEKRKEKMLRLSQLQRKIDEATEEMCNVEAHKNIYNYRYQDHDGCNHDNLRHEEFNVQDFLYDEASPLTV
jgi:hypothetical protein